MTAVILLSHGFQAEYEVGFANGLARNGMRVTLIGSDTTLLHRLDATVTCVNLRGSQRSDRTRAEKAANMLRYWIRYLWFIARRPRNTVHVIGLFSTRSSVAGVLEAWLTRLAAGKFVLTVHNVLPHDRHTRVEAFLARMAYRAASYLMVHTEKMARDLREGLGLSGRAIVVVEHGVDRLVDADAILREDARRALGIPRKDRVVLFFGKVARYKGLDVLLRAFALRQVQVADRLIIAGECRDARLQEELASLLATHPRRDDISWMNRFVSDVEVTHLLRAADLLVMPYRHIDQSGVLFAAFAARLPVVVTDVGSLRDYVREDAGAVVPPEDPEALAGAIADRLKRGAQRLPRERVEQYLWHRTVAPLLAVYRRMQEKAA